MDLAALVTASVALATGVVGVLFRHHLDKLLLVFRLDSEYKYEQRSHLRDVVGRHVGQLLETTESWNHRMWNLYVNEGQGWLRVEAQDYAEIPPDQNYYFKSMVFRFLAVFANLRQFEREALLVDTTVAERRYLDFVKYAKAMFWCMTNVALFRGIDYDSSSETDHFFADWLRARADYLIGAKAFTSFAEFEELIRQPGPLIPVLDYFRDLNATENRLRWDRLVAFHLLTMAFLNKFGYDMQRSSQVQLGEAARHLRHKQVASNLRTWIPKLGLGEEPEAKGLSEALPVPRRPAAGETGDAT